MCAVHYTSPGGMESRECWELCRINSIYKIDQTSFQLHCILHGYLTFIIFMSGAAEPVRMSAHTAMIQFDTDELLCGISLVRLLIALKDD